VERRHDEGGQADEAAEPALQLVGRAFFFLDVVLGAPQRLFADGRGRRPGDRAGLGFDDAAPAEPPS
jgi:hypothetical protein